ncbi:hypothetical protein [Agrobacterium burrii]
MRKFIMLTAAMAMASTIAHAQMVNKDAERADMAALLILSEIAATDCKVIVDVSGRDMTFRNAGYPVEELRASETYAKAKTGMWDELKPQGITRANICPLAKGVMQQRRIKFVE